MSAMNGTIEERSWMSERSCFRGRHRQGLSHRAGRIPVLQSLDIEVRDGEMLAITGASGVGKSTLLHVLGTLDRPEDGALRFAGLDILTMKESDLRRFRNRSLGFVFQMHHLLPEFTAIENVMMPLLIGRRSVREAEGIARTLLIELGLKDRLHHRPSALSGASNSAWPWRAPWLHRLGPFSPTSRPAIWTRRRAETA